MKLKMPKMLLGLSLLASLAVVSTSVVYAGAKPKAKTSSQVSAKKGKASKGGDSNIKTRRAPNSANHTKKAPPTKGGPATKGSWGKLTVKNYTGYIIDIYVDDDYSGTVDDYGDAEGDFSTGYHTLYARADFDDGTYLYWGPESVYIGSNGFIWRLNP